MTTPEEQRRITHTILGHCPDCGSFLTRIWRKATTFGASNQLLCAKCGIAPCVIGDLTPLSRWRLESVTRFAAFLLFFVSVSAFAQNECTNNPPNIAIAVNNSRGNDNIVHQTICWNPQTNTISIPSLAFPPGSPLTTKGDLFTFTTVNARLPVGTNGQILSANSAQATGLQWIAPPGASFPINLPDGTVTTPQLSSASNPTDGFYIAAGFPNWIFEVAGTQVFAFRGSVSGGIRAIALGSGASVCFATNNTLDANAAANCDGYLHRAGVNAMGFGSTGGANDGTFQTGTLLSTRVSLSDGDVNTPQFLFTSVTGSGLFYDPATGQGNWTDSTGLGSPLWGFNTTVNNGKPPSVWVDPSGFFGFNASGTCDATRGCLTGTANGVASSNDGTNSATGTMASSANTSARYLTATNCSATGTAANPSVASCNTAAAGAFSCATAASTGTCTVNTSAVTANSRIFVQSSSAEGANIGVTCNTAPTLVPTILLKTKGVGTFTINMPTIATNPECFTFLVMN